MSSYIKELCEKLNSDNPHLGKSSKKQINSVCNKKRWLPFHNIYKKDNVTGKYNSIHIVIPKTCDSGSSYILILLWTIIDHGDFFFIPTHYSAGALSYNPNIQF